MEKSLKELINDINAGDKDALWELIQRFKPLINKYKRKLGYDGAEEDIILWLVKAVKKYKKVRKMINFNDNKITAYIAKGMKNEYIRLSKKNVKIKENELLIFDDKEIIIDNFEYENIENKIFVQEVLNKLTPLKKMIILETIIYGKKKQI